ncbi:MAG TPA: primosomal replication protein N [Burkholderiaceae bacterium]|nr:primosomal replication protein N [Burkholderiaceae bacterium]
MNQLQLSASIEQVYPMRYTPAGLPAIDVVLSHESEVIDTGIPRQVKLSLRAVAFGSMAETLAVASLEAKWEFKGFLGLSRNGKGVVFHIQDIHSI